MSILRVQSVGLIDLRIRVDWERVGHRSNILLSCSSFLPLRLKLGASGQADGVQNVEREADRGARNKLGTRTPRAPAPT